MAYGRAGTGRENLKSGYIVYFINLTSVLRFLTNSVFVYYTHDRIEVKSKNYNCCGRPHQPDLSRQIQIAML